MAIWARVRNAMSNSYIRIQAAREKSNISNTDASSGISDCTAYEIRVYPLRKSKSEMKDHKLSRKKRKNSSLNGKITDLVFTRSEAEKQSA